MRIACEFNGTKTCHSIYKSKNCVKIKWENTDKEYYRTLVSEKITELNKDLDTRLKCNLELAIQGFTDILIDTAKKTTKISKNLSRKPKLKVWNVEISNALQRV